MAPEQLQSQKTDARSDIFAFGLVFYELLTGRRAFNAENPASLIASILTAQPPPVATFAPGIPPAVEYVLQRALAKDPEDRWQSARDLKAQLEWLATASGIIAVPPAGSRLKRRHAWLPWAVAGVMMCVAGGLAWTRWTVQPQPPPMVRFEVSPPRGEKFSFDRPNISPDGQKVLFSTAAELGGPCSCGSTTFPGEYRRRCTT
jgi:serine/threonine protein kinase